MSVVSIRFIEIFNIVDSGDSLKISAAYTHNRRRIVEDIHISKSENGMIDKVYSKYMQDTIPDDDEFTQNIVAILAESQKYIVKNKR